jgi:SAM-dependent methyltransferase
MTDPSKTFGAPSSNYTLYRPNYPADVFDFLKTHLRSGRELGIDLGAGSGQATRQLASIFDRVIAVEPDERLANDAALPENADIHVKAAEAAEFADASIDAVISATAFHWMDQPAICQNAARWLKPGGVFFPFAYDVFRFENGVHDYFAEEFEKWRPYRDPRLDENYDYPDVLHRSGTFSSVETLRSEMSLELSTDDAAGLICSASYAAAYARATSSPDVYLEEVRNSLSEFGECIRVFFPIIGAIGRVD